jgi:hypothetical protein
VILHTPTQVGSRRGKARTRIGLAAGLTMTAALIALPVASAVAGGGGTSVTGSGGGTQTTGSGDTDSGSCGKAKIVHGRATVPDCAPRRVKRVIRAANDIAKGADYCYGGGHGSFKSNCYDCSGAVSYALHGGHFVDSPMDSGGFMRWAKKGKGDWFTVYSNPGHAFLAIAGLRFDTSMTKGKGPGWADRIKDENLRDFKHRAKPKY